MDVSDAESRPGWELRRVRSLGGIAARSSVMHMLFDTIERLAHTDVAITLAGETGTGKDVLARVVHECSPRKNGPFVVLDCGAVAANLAESELFGHERGSFTGAVRAHLGAFERAHGGTLFLDEVGEMPLELQPRLLRAIESHRVRRVGGPKDRPVNVRVVAATNRDLQGEVAAGRFRQDLYYRLCAAVLHIPPLRDRTDDIGLLVRRLLDDMGHAEMQVSDEALTALHTQPWPGNVRELKNMLACAVAFADDGVIELQHLQRVAHRSGRSAFERLQLGGRRLSFIERTAIEQTLAQTGGNKMRAARALGIAVSTLYEKLKRYQL